MQSPSDPWGQETARAAPGATPPYSHEEQLYGHGRSASHKNYVQQPAQVPGPPPPHLRTNGARMRPVRVLCPSTRASITTSMSTSTSLVVQQPTLSLGKLERSIVDWANHTQSQHPLAHSNQLQPIPPGLGPITGSPAAAVFVATSGRAQTFEVSRAKWRPKPGAASVDALDYGGKGRVACFGCASSRATGTLRLAHKQRVRRHHLRPITPSNPPQQHMCGIPYSRQLGTGPKITMLMRGPRLTAAAQFDQTCAAIPRVRTCVRICAAARIRTATPNRPHQPGYNRPNCRERGLTSHGTATFHAPDVDESLAPQTYCLHPTTRSYHWYAHRL